MNNEKLQVKNPSFARKCLFFNSPITMKEKEKRKKMRDCRSEKKQSGREIVSAHLEEYWF